MKQKNAYMKICVNNLIYRVPCEKLRRVSRYFEVMMSGGSNYVENILLSVNLGNQDPESFSVLAMYLTTGLISFRSDQAIPVYAACLYLQLTELHLKRFTRFIKKYFPKINVLALFQFLHDQCDDVLIHEVRWYIARNFETIIFLKDFVRISNNVLLDLLYENLNISQPNFPITAISKWLAYNVSRRNDVHDLIAELTQRNDHEVQCYPAKWNKKEIFACLKRQLFPPKPESKKMISTAVKRFEPWFVMRKNGAVNFYHCNCHSDTRLFKPSFKFDHDIIGIRAARRNHLVYVFLDHQIAYETITDFVMYDYFCDKYTYLRLPNRPRLKQYYAEVLTIMNDNLVCCGETFVQKFIPEIGIWQSLPSPTRGTGGRRIPVYASDGRYLYALGSRNAFTDYETKHIVEFYDERCSNWLKLPSMLDTQYRSLRCGAYASKNLFVTGGIQLENYDIRAGKWRMLPDIRTYYANPKYLVQMENYMCILNTYGRMFRYDMSGDRWVRPIIYEYGKSSGFEPVNCVDDLLEIAAA